MLLSRTGCPRPAGTLLPLLGAICVGLAAGPQTAEATTVRGLSLYEKSQIAQAIVQAEVVSVATAWEREGQAARTLVTFRIKSVLKGASKVGESFVLLQAGGKIGNFVHEIPGMSAFRAGEEAILFLEPYQNYQVEIGIGIGKYGIETDQSGARLVTHDPSVALVFTTPDGATQIEEAKPMTPERLDKFRARVLGYVNGDRKPAALKAAPTLKPTLTPDPIPGKN